MLTTKDKLDLLAKEELGTYLGGLADALHMKKAEIREAIKFLTEEQ